MSDDLKQRALDYHRYPRPGKLEIKATKPLATARDLSLAYSPGVAHACKEIEADPVCAADYTARGNLVAVITNGTAVLGLGPIGSLASKPVMEGKAVLFKQFANVDVFDIEIDELDPQKFIDTVARLEPTFGGINLEDIKAPECFIIEKGLKERMNIPVFHDDQHGTAIVVGAAVYNGLSIVNKKIEEVKLVASGAGAAALACLGLLVKMGLKKENIIVTDIEGVVYKGRSENMDPYLGEYAIETDKRTLEEALPGADIFLGLSAGGVLKPEFLKDMAANPLILALANPTPEIMPDLAKEARPDAIVATGRSDFPNQVNNVLCFPFLFRGALDVGATEINEDMKKAAVKAIADLAKAEISDIVRSAYGGQRLQFGREYIIPKPFDHRLIGIVAPAVAKAAMESGVAQRPIMDLEGYRNELKRSVFKTSMAMKPVFDQARQESKQVVYAEGEEEKVLQAVQQVVDDNIARPILLGSPEIIEERIKDLGLSIKQDKDFEVIDPHNHPHYKSFTIAFSHQMARLGYSSTEARSVLRSNPTVLAALMVRLKYADAMICGTVGRYKTHLKYIKEIIGMANGVKSLTALNVLVLQNRTLFITDTRVHAEPSATEIAEIVRLCADEVRWFGVNPRIALLSHSNLGSDDSRSSLKMREAITLVQQLHPDLEVDGEMDAIHAMNETMRNKRVHDSKLTGYANLLVMPNQDAASITFDMLKEVSGGISIGPILVGAARSAHIITPSTTVRGILNMTGVAAVRAS